MPKHVLGPALYSVLTVLGVCKGTIELKMGRDHDQASVSLKKKSKSMVMGHGRRMLPWADSRNKTEMVLPKESSPALLDKIYRKSFLPSSQCVSSKIHAATSQYF